MVKFLLNKAKEHGYFFDFLKKHRYLIMTFLLFLFGTLITGLVGLCLFGIPLGWLLYECIFLYLKKNHKEVGWHVPHMIFCFRWSIGISFVSFLWFLIFTPTWMQKLSLFLERNSFIALFSVGSFMYGRLFVTLIIFSVVFLGGYILLKPKFPSTDKN